MPNFTKYNYKYEQSGAVSIFSVIFFIIIVNIITISFVRIVNIEQQQATDNSSSASALAAARSGIEDGKRALLYLKDQPDTNPIKASILNGSAGCEAIYSNLSSELGLKSDGEVFKSSATGEGQYVTCLKIVENTETYESVVSPGGSVIVPLKNVGDVPIGSIDFSWHTQDDGALITKIYPSVNPSVSEVGSAASWMRLQLIVVPKNNITRDSISSSTAFIGASIIKDDSSPLVPGVISFLPDEDEVATAGAVAAYPKVTCKAGLPYGCAANASSLSLDTAGNDYYLRVSPIHKKTHFSVRMYGVGGASGALDFRGVQPRIDSTGRTGGTFRRLRANVSYTVNADIPSYVAESLGSDPNQGMICKDIKVTAAGVDTSACPD